MSVCIVYRFSMLKKKDSFKMEKISVINVIGKLLCVSVHRLYTYIKFTVKIEKPFHL